MGRVSSNGKRYYTPKAYTSQHLYIVDYPQPKATTRKVMNRQKQDPHKFKCESIEDVFKEHSDTTVHHLRLLKRSNEDDFFQYWDDALQNKTENDLVIIYFHGSASGCEEEYKWTLTQGANIQINAHRFIDEVTRYDADSLFLLDCFIPTRVTKKWTRESGNTEIIARPECIYDADGKVKASDGDFTEAVAGDLESYLKEIDTRFRRAKKMKSIPEILAYDDAMYSNPIRIWLNRTKEGSEDVVKRFKVCPNRIRATRKLEFFAVQIQGPAEDEPEEEDIEEDDMAENGDVDEGGSDDGNGDDNGDGREDTPRSNFNDEGLADMDAAFDDGLFCGE